MKSTDDESKRYVSNPVVSCGDEGDDGAVLFNPDTNDTIIINQTGKSIWEFLRTPCTSDEVASYLETEYHVGAEHRPAEEVEAFLKTLVPGFVRQDGAAP
ncbi:PqqD family protein [bacterium]|nr:PqqD family protein [bacterium]